MPEPWDGIVDRETALRWAVHALSEIQRGSIGMTTRQQRQRAMTRHLGASAMLGQGSPKTWWYLTFLDLSNPDDPQFLGATHVEGHDPLSAVRRSWELGINPGHEVMFEDCEDRVPKPAFRDQLHDSVGFLQDHGEEVYTAT